MKILIIHATAGAGHFKAGEALYNYLKKTTSHDVQLVDGLDYTSPLFKQLYKQTYFILIAKFPWLWGICFEALDIPWLQPLVRFVRRIYNKCNTRKLVSFLKKEKFDYIFTTHFLSNEVCSHLKKKQRISAKLVTVVTDFDVHRIWLAPSNDMYVVASDWTKEKLKQLGVPPSKIAVTGIPTAEEFATPKNKRELRRKLGLQEDLFTVLMATGSFGIGPIEEMIDKLHGVQTLIVCGHNQSLFKRLSEKPRKNVKAYSMVNNIPELMGASDIMVTKPGGLSISEALVSRLPLIFFNAIPGQETNNIKVLKHYGVGISDRTTDQIIMEIKRLEASPEALSAAINQTQQLAQPDAVKKIANLIQ